MVKAGEPCPRCADGQLLLDGEGELSCVQCGNIVYTETPAEYEPDRRSHTDNRQNPTVFAEEYRRALPKEEFDEAFKDFKDIMEEQS
ncbi:hypothetical protein LCGC14_1761720 [marine sediment metagenome]|uniref:TFIIB-type domain-containing protein n=1 Tax=marine sediment metagenome TaxID=412755 RepID=A0A0F9HN70_9ZZZZ